ncbi:MAG TPA: hypothetical protein VMY42_26675 [Thermoguttaceae bacterium]|nr:hypothetical protein [Thermoguttaceae bacterium]
MHKVPWPNIGYINAILLGALRLMLCADMMSSALRWTDRLDGLEEKEETATVETDRLMSIVAAIGWAAEAVLLVRKGNGEGWVRRDLLQRASEQKLWDECTAGQLSSRLARCCAVRDKCFAHWDPNVAQKCVDTLAQQDELPAVVESDDDEGKFLKVRFPWAYMAIAMLVFQTEDIEDLRKELRAIVKTLADVNTLVRYLILGKLQGKLIRP